MRDLSLNNKLLLYSIRVVGSMIKKNILFIIILHSLFRTSQKTNNDGSKSIFYSNQCLQQPSFMNKSQKRILANDAKATVFVVYNRVAIKQLCHSFLFVKLYLEHFYKILSGKYGKEFMKK